MQNLEGIKAYLIKNKNVAVLSVILLACLCAYAAVSIQKSKASQDVLPEAADSTKEFIVFDYNEQKLKYAEEKEKKELQELEVENNETEDAFDDNIENILSNLPIGNNKVNMGIRTAGRNNPFAPYIERSLSGGSTFDIVEPPQYIPDEIQAQDLMQTTVSGILYNAQKSSAIINVDGTDQLVNKGDKIAGFQIVDITRNKVYVKKGYNIIAAGVGESIEEPELTYNSVYNLHNKFGGKYTKVPQKSVIMINGESN